MKCPVCDQPIKKGDNGAVVAFGYWKQVSEDGEIEDSDFDPNGEEFDVCSDCADDLRTAINMTVRRRLSSGKPH